MNNKPSGVIDITIDLRDFVQIALSYGYLEQVRIPSYIAEIIKAKTKNQSLCYIQETDEWGDKLDSPYLWDYKRWMENQERRRIQKAYSEKQRELRFVEEYNIKIVAEQVQADLLVDWERAVDLAMIMVRNKQMNKLKVFGIESLIVDVKEIP